MARILKIRPATREVLEDPGLALRAEVNRGSLVGRDQPNEALGKVGIEPVEDEHPPGRSVGARDRPSDVLREVLLGARRRQRRRNDFARRNFEIRSQALRSVANVLVLSALDLARLHRQRRRGDLERLDPGLLVTRDDACSCGEERGRLLVQLADRAHLRLVPCRIVDFGIQPVLRPVRFELRPL